MSYQQKYLKYKTKYNLLKIQRGGLNTIRSQKGGSPLGYINSSIADIDFTSKITTDGSKLGSTPGLRQDTGRSYIFNACLSDLFNARRLEDAGIQPTDTLTEELMPRLFTYIHEEVKQLYDSINSQIYLKEHNTIPMDIQQHAPGYHFLIGASSIKSPNGSIGYELATNIAPPTHVRTFSRSENITDSNHFTWDTFTTEQCPKNTNINIDTVNTEGITFYFMLAKHAPSGNVAIATENIVAINNAVAGIKQFIDHNEIEPTKCRLVITGTDALYASTNPTFYKIFNFNIEYAISKLYQLIKGAEFIELLSEGSSQFTNDIIKLMDLFTRYNIDQNKLTVIHDYDELVVDVLSRLDKVNNFGWAKGLSLICTPMHYTAAYNNLLTPEKNAFAPLETVKPKTSNSSTVKELLDNIHTQIAEWFIKKDLNRCAHTRAQELICVKEAAYKHYEAYLHSIRHISQRGLGAEKLPGSGDANALNGKRPFKEISSRKYKSYLR